MILIYEPTFSPPTKPPKWKSLLNSIPLSPFKKYCNPPPARTLKKVTELSKKIGLIENPALTKGFKLKAITVIVCDNSEITFFALSPVNSHGLVLFIS